MLGPLEIERDGETVQLTSHRQRAVLAMLVMAQGRTVTVDRLIDGVWGEDLPANPNNTLQHAVAQIRKTLEPDRIRSEKPSTVLSTDGGYRIGLDAHDVDVIEFDAAVETARTEIEDGNPADAAAGLAAALDLWRGEAYAGFEAEGFADGEQQRLAERRLVARELLVDANLTAAGPEAVIADLEALVVEHPHREGLWGRLMTALYQAGRQADALRAYQRAASVLGEDLGLLPSPELQAVEQQILLQDPELAPPPSEPSAGTPANNLPSQTTPLIGREQELSSLFDALETARLVTLLGPGGSGKTRLAVEAAILLSTRATGRVGADGIWLVRLDDLTESSLLAPSIGAAARMPESAAHEVEQTLANHIADRRVLLLLDNCEHLLDAVADLVHTLTASCPRLVVLATSQAPLRVTGEHRVAVPPLALPGDEGSPFADLENSPAMRLFIDRATAIGTDPSLLNEQRNAIANIVRALDGLPLAIELAAARTDLLTPVEIAQLLADRFELLTDGPRDAPHRQRTLSNTVAWSHGLLDIEEQAFFMKLCVFNGSFEARAAAAVIGTTESEALTLIGRLVTRSLVGREPGSGGPSRFRILESLRHFGLRLLTTAGEESALRERHAQFYADEAERLDRLLTSSDQASAFASFVANEDNTRAAMVWSLDAGVDDPAQWTPAARIGARTGRFWDWRGSLAEANTWLSRIVDVITDERVPELPIAISWLGYFAAELGDLDRADALVDRADAIARAQSDDYALSLVESGRAMYTRLRGDPRAAIEAAARLRAISVPAGDHWGTAWADNHDALAHLALGDHEAAAASGDRSRLGFSRLGDQRATGWALTVLAQIALETGANTEARDLASEALTLSVEVGDGRNAAWTCEVAAAVARAENDEQQASALEERAAEYLAERGMPRSPWQRS